MNILDRFKLKLAKYNKSICKTSDGITHIFSKNREKAGKLDKNGCKTGLWITTYYDRIIESATYLDDMLSGPYSGEEEVEYICAVITGSRIVDTAGEFANGLKEGKWTEGNASGNYTSGLRSGFWQVPNTYDELIKGHYSAGLKTGIWKGENSKYVFNNDILEEAQWLHGWNGDMHISQYQEGILTAEKVYDHTGDLKHMLHDGISSFFWEDWEVRIDSRRKGWQTFQRHDKSEFFEIYLDEVRGMPEIHNYTVTDGKNNYPIQFAIDYVNMFVNDSYEVNRNPDWENVEKVKTNRSGILYLFETVVTINGIIVDWTLKNNVIEFRLKRPV
jgi:hypothetical protein